MSIDREFSSFVFPFGWRPSSPEKLYLHERRYAWSVFFPLVAVSVEVELATDPRFKSWYDQGNMNACVGASWSRAMASINQPQVGPMKYNWKELYCKACEIDNDPQTSCKADVGTFLWAGGDVLRRFGAYVDDGWKQDHGIESYYWARSSDDCRTALSLGRPLVFGFPWRAGWMPDNLVQKNSEWFIPERSKWGRAIGGHAICALAASDTRGAVAVFNSWGEAYPEKVWFPYADIDFLLTQGGSECAVPVDLPWQNPEPPPSDSVEFDQIVYKEGDALWQAVNVTLARVK